MLVSHDFLLSQSKLELQQITVFCLLVLSTDLCMNSTDSSVICFTILHGEAEKNEPISLVCILIKLECFRIH